ncbi:MAG: TRAP transporter permease [Alphaproteobacteria bacterium]
MSDEQKTAPESDNETKSFIGEVVFWLGLILVLVGLINVTPGIPGWDDLWKSVTGNQFFRVRRFETEMLYPLVFFLMMLIVALKHSLWRSWVDRVKWQRILGLMLDIALVTAAAALSLTYMIEIEAICLLDVITGDRERMIAEALQGEIEFAELTGLPIPTTVEDPFCLNTTAALLPLIVFLCVVIFLLYNVKVWGLPLVLISIIVSIYTLATILNWFFFGAEGQNKYLMTILSSEEPRSLGAGYEVFHDALVNHSAGFFGRFMNVLMLMVFPYIVLGSLFGRCAGGQSLIKLAFLLTRNLRGGPAHAAVFSSAMFGTITGGPVVNVLSTGVLTIPMMLKRGFSRVFAGGVEAAASSGGSIMPPILGVAAFVMAALTGVAYREIVIAAIIPAVLYFFCLFLSVIFQSRKQNIGAVGKITDDMRLSGSDWLHLTQVLGPVLLILVLLLTPKDSVGCSWYSIAMGADVIREAGSCRVISLPWLPQAIQNAAGDAGAAGWWAVVLLIVLMFVDRTFRQNPGKVLGALAAAGVSIATLYLMFLAVTVIDVSLTLTAFSKFLSVDVLTFLRTFDIGSGSIWFVLLALLLTMILAVVLGMGMPAVPAYINVALLLGPMLVGLGLSTLTSHMFIFYFAVASAITPPVALAAFAAATITKADPMQTGLSAVRSGIVIFTIPFVFAIYPELLMIDKAVMDPSVPGTFLPGYTGELQVLPLLLLIGRVILSLYFVASALAGYDAKALSPLEIGLRLALAALILFKPIEVYGPAIIAWVAVIVFHYYQARRAKAAA